MTSESKVEHEKIGQRLCQHEGRHCGHCYTESD
jgi:hypothetical protein